MMNENVAKVYADLVEIRDGLMTAENQATIEGYLKRLDDALVYLQTEDEYAGWAVSLRDYVNRFDSGTAEISLEYIINYTDKLAELIEVKNEPAGNKFTDMREDAREICGNIASTVQLGYEAARDKVKENGPRYAAEAASTIRGFGQKVGDRLRKWLEDDDPDSEGEENDSDEER